MSGIAGIIFFDGKPVAPGQVEAMTAAMHSRGPHGINHWRRGNVALGQCMLRTTPESLEETQPLTNEDQSLVLVMDGRVDNYEALRRELLGKGAVLRTRADAELVLRAYEVWGQDCPERIIGEYVFFIWDAQQQRFFGARDAAGTRHFYYHAGNGWFAFASEIKGLLALPQIKRRLNESRMLDYLVVAFDRDDEVGTFYQDILRMPAGHAMTATLRGPRIWRWWQPGELAESRFASLDECTEAFLAQMRIAVKCRLRSIGPVGAMLSGGLDSSSIVGLISKEFRAELPQPLKTFTLIREDRENCPDWLATREMLKDDWLTPVVLTSAVASEKARSYFDAIQGMDEPLALSAGFTNALVFDAARDNGCNVVLDGMAGDLFFYDLSGSMNAIFRGNTLSHLPGILAAYRRHDSLRAGLGSVARMSARAVAPDWALATYRKTRDRETLRFEQRVDEPGNLLGLLHHETARQFVANKLVSRKTAQDELVHPNDQATHAHRFTTGMLSFAHEVYGQIALSGGVEPRSPFSDRRMIEFAIQMPLEAKLAKHWYKHTLRRSMAQILPADVLWRLNTGGHPGWQFYERLVTATAQNDLGAWNLTRLKDKIKCVDSSKLSQVWDTYRATRDYGIGYNLLLLVILAEWLEGRFLEG
jgi:asparagine synthase (glutamine-hydrolysing)